MNHRTIVAAAMAAFLVACGGGGGSSDSVPAGTFNLEAAFTNSLTPGISFTGLSGTDGVYNYEVDFSYRPGPDGVFQGHTYKTTVFSSTMRVDGMTLGTSSATEYFTLNPTRVAGTISNDGFVTTIVYDGAAPTNATVGSSGPYFQGTGSVTVDGTTVYAHSTTTWSLEEDTANTAWACLSTASPELPAYSQKECYRINRAGAISGAKIVLYAEGDSMTLQ